MDRQEAIDITMKNYPYLQDMLKHVFEKIEQSAKDGKNYLYYNPQEYPSAIIIKSEYTLATILCIELRKLGFIAEFYPTNCNKIKITWL